MLHETNIEYYWNVTARQAVKIEELEHEVCHLKSVLRRIIGYVDSVRSVAGLEEHLGPYSEAPNDSGN